MLGKYLVYHLEGGKQTKKGGGGIRKCRGSLTNKRLSKKSWHRQRDQESRQVCQEMKRRAKREVAKAKAKAYEDLYLCYCLRPVCSPSSQ